MLSKDEAIKNIEGELDSLLSNYRKDVAIVVKSNMIAIITTALFNKLPIQNKKFHIGAGFRERWHDDEQQALYFDMILSFKYYTSGKINVILKGEYVDSYMNAIDCGLKIENVQITIPLNYKPGPMQNLINIFSILLRG